MEGVAGSIPAGRTISRLRRNLNRVSGAHGALAQLGERFHGMEEVIGSIPLGSTNSFTRYPVQASSGRGGTAWGLSSAGRAPAWHAGGQRFDPARLHQYPRASLEGRQASRRPGTPTDEDTRPAGSLSHVDIRASRLRSSARLERFPHKEDVGWFKSTRSHQSIPERGTTLARVAQLVELSTDNRAVAGSIPAACTTSRAHGAAARGKPGHMSGPRPVRCRSESIQQRAKRARVAPRPR